MLLILSLATLLQQGAPCPQEQDEARELLERLERSHARVEVFTSPLTYRKVYALEGDFETRLGEVAARLGGDDREIILYFDRVIDASGHGTDRPRYHIYEKGWWTEVDPGRKRVVHRQLAADDASMADPFELGEGPMPLPIGQKADRVMERFDVTITEIPEDPLFKGVRNVVVLHLVPKAGIPAAEDHASFDLLYDRDSLLPVGILVTHINGDTTTAWLRSPTAGADGVAVEGRASEVKALIRRSASDEAWTIERKPLAAPEAGAGAGS